jgi:putative endonuclease
LSEHHYYYRCMVTNKKGGILYLGVTNNLLRRARKHKDNIVDGFTQKRGVHNLVYVEEYDDIRKAISREKQLKKWEREWKVRLIEEFNPEWKDLYSELNCQDEFGAIAGRQAKGAAQGGYSFILTYIVGKDKRKPVDEKVRRRTERIFVCELGAGYGCGFDFEE